MSRYLKMKNTFIQTFISTQTHLHIHSFAHIPQAAVYKKN